VHKQKSIEIFLGFLRTLDLPYISISAVHNLSLLFRQGSQTKAQLWLALSGWISWDGHGQNWGGRKKKKKLYSRAV